MSKLSIFKEFLYFLKKSRNWWLMPVLIVLVLVGVLLVIGQSSVLAPVIYTMF